MVHKSDRAKVYKRGKGKLKKDEMKVDEDAPQGESAETKSSIRKLIRAEAEETLRLRLWDAGNQQEEAEESAFVPRVTRINLFLRQKLLGTGSGGG